MKKIYRGAAIFIFLSLLGSHALSSAQEEDGGAILRFDKKDVELSEVMQGETIQHTFKVFNDGKKPLTIKKVQPG
jgi:hypothetical protein